MIREIEPGLVKRIKAGEYSLFETIIEEYQNPLFAFLYRMVRDVDDAKDLCQDTFYKAYKYLRSFREEARFSTWLFRIGYRLALNLLKKKKRQSETMNAVAQEHDFQSKTEPYELKEMSLIVERIMDGIPYTHRAALYLFYKEDKSYSEIASIMKIPENTVKSHLFRGKDMIRSKLSRDYRTESWGK